MSNEIQKIQHGDPFPYESDRSGEMDWCNVCGRRIGKTCYWVEVVDGGAVWDSKTYGPADQHDAGYMGCYPVGRECAKRFKAGIAVRQESEKE